MRWAERCPEGRGYGTRLRPIVATKIVSLVLYMRNGSESDPCAVVSSGGGLARISLLYVTIALCLCTIVIVTMEDVWDKDGIYPSRPQIVS